MVCQAIRHRQVGCYTTVTQRVDHHGEKPMRDERKQNHADALRLFADDRE